MRRSVTKFCLSIEVWAVQKHVNLVDLVKSFQTNILLQSFASIQRRTSPLKFGHLAGKSEREVRYRTFQLRSAWRRGEIRAARRLRKQRSGKSTTAIRSGLARISCAHFRYTSSEASCVLQVYCQASLAEARRGSGLHSAIMPLHFSTIHTFFFFRSFSM